MAVRGFMSPKREPVIIERGSNRLPEGGCRIRKTRLPRSRRRATGAIPVDPVDYLCKGGSCPAVTAEGEPIYTDPVHMRPFFVRSRVRYLDPALGGTSQLSFLPSR